MESQRFVSLRNSKAEELTRENDDERRWKVYFGHLLNWVMISGFGRND